MNRKLLLFLILLVPATTFAQYDTLVNIPQISGDGFDNYINAIYALFISLAALLAVVKIIVAGVKYMFSDVVTQKSEAKRDIWNAVWGLVLVGAAVLILTIINVDLTTFDLNRNITQLDRVEGQGDTSTLSRVEQIIAGDDHYEFIGCTCEGPTRRGSCVSGSFDCSTQITNCSGASEQIGDNRIACIYETEPIDCSSSTGRGGTTVYDCNAARTACEDSGRQIVSTAGATPRAPSVQCYGTSG